MDEENQDGRQERVKETMGDKKEQKKQWENEQK